MGTVVQIVEDIFLDKTCIITTSSLVLINSQNASSHSLANCYLLGGVFVNLRLLSRINPQTRRAKYKGRVTNEIATNNSEHFNDQQFGQSV